MKRCCTNEPYEQHRLTCYTRISGVAEIDPMLAPDNNTRTLAESLKIAIDDFVNTAGLTDVKKIWAFCAADTETLPYTGFFSNVVQLKMPTLPLVDPEDKSTIFDKICHLISDKVHSAFIYGKTTNGSAMIAFFWHFFKLKEWNVITFCDNAEDIPYVACNYVASEFVEKINEFMERCHYFNQVQITANELSKLGCDIVDTVYPSPNGSDFGVISIADSFTMSVCMYAGCRDHVDIIMQKYATIQNKRALLAIKGPAHEFGFRLELLDKQCGPRYAYEPDFDIWYFYDHTTYNRVINFLLQYLDDPKSSEKFQKLAKKIADKFDVDLKIKK